MDERFPDRWIGRCGPVGWPPRSLGLTVLDYCLLSWFNSEVYKVKLEDAWHTLIRRIKNDAGVIK